MGRSNSTGGRPRISIRAAPARRAARSRWTPAPAGKGPSSPAGLHGGPWPADVQNRSYLTNGVCGPGTSYACASPSVPTPRRNSAHLDPAGELVGPR